MAKATRRKEVYDPVFEEVMKESPLGELLRNMRSRFLTIEPVKQGEERTALDLMVKKPSGTVIVVNVGPKEPHKFNSFLRDSKKLKERGGRIVEEVKDAVFEYAMLEKYGLYLERLAGQELAFAALASESESEVKESYMRRVKEGFARWREFLKDQREKFLLAQGKELKSYQLIVSLGGRITDAANAELSNIGKFGKKEIYRRVIWELENQRETYPKVDMLVDSVAYALVAGEKDADVREWLLDFVKDAKEETLRLHEQALSRK